MSILAAPRMAMGRQSTVLLPMVVLGHITVWPTDSAQLRVATRSIFAAYMTFMVPVLAQMAGMAATRIASARLARLVMCSPYRPMDIRLSVRRLRNLSIWKAQPHLVLALIWAGHNAPTVRLLAQWQHAAIYLAPAEMSGGLMMLQLVILAIRDLCWVLRR